MCRILESPRENRQIPPIAKDLEWTHVADLPGEVYRHILASLVDRPIPRFTEPDQVVILSHYLAGGTRKIDGERRHGAAQVIHVEDQIGMQVRSLAPEHPADAWINQTILVPRRVDGFYARKLEIPQKVWLNKRREESAARSVDMDGNVQSGIQLQLIERRAQCADIFVVPGEGAAQHGDH